MKMNKNNIIDLVNQALKKDNQAMETLYNLYYKDVLFVCKKLNLNNEDANDIAQDTFIDAFSKLNTLTDKSKFKVWVMRIANNKALNLLKHNNIIKFDNLDDDNSYVEIPDKSKNIEDQFIENEVATTLRNIIEKLPLEQKITVFMYYYEDMSVKEIAAAYNCSENTVRSRLNYAKNFITAEVNKLENNNIKLRCTALIPFLFLIFAKEYEVFAATVPNTAIPSSTSVIAKSMKTFTSSSAKTLSIGKIIGIVVASIAVISATVVGITLISKNNNPNIEILETKDDISNTTSKDEIADNNNTITDSTDSTENETYETGNEYWDYYPIESLNMPEIEYTEIEYANGMLTANIADTFFTLSVDDIKEIINNSDLHNGKNYAIYTKLTEDCIIKNFTDVGTQKRYTVRNDITAYSNENSEYSDYSITMTTDYANYNTPNKIEVHINNITLSRDFQKEAFTFLESIFGNEIATYLTYGEDIDGKDTVGSAYGSTMYEAVKIGSTYYKLQRWLTSGSEGANEDGVHFVVIVSHKDEKSKSGNQSFYNANYTSAITPSTFSLDNYILGNFGSTNTNNISTFGSEYMKHGLDEIYVKTQSEGYTYVINTNPDGSTSNSFTMTTIKNCENYINLYTPELDISITNCVKDGELVSLEAKFQGEIGIAPPNEGTPDYSPLYQPFLKKVKAILGENTDLSEITLEKFLSEEGISFEAIYLGKPCDVTLNYSQYVNMAPLMSGDFDITITSK